LTREVEGVKAILGTKGMKKIGWMNEIDVFKFIQYQKKIKRYN
jgi:hypothetical protein